MFYSLPQLLSFPRRDKGQKVSMCQYLESNFTLKVQSYDGFKLMQACTTTKSGCPALTPTLS